MSVTNWGTLLVRVIFTALLAAVSVLFRPFGLSTLASLSLGAVLGLLLNFIEIRIRRASAAAILAGSAGALTGSLLGLLLVLAVSPAALSDKRTTDFIRFTLPLSCAFLGLLVGVAKSGLLNLGALGFFSNSETAVTSQKILDTSVIIDGRIADIAESGFLDGKTVIPHFVLHELQLVADSADSAKRNRGRRGLDVIQRLQKLPGLQIEVSSEDFPAIREVDLKLIEFARLHGSTKIVTNDFNLSKLAQVQGVDVLNINELASALKPVVLPGEVMRVFILKEGKEHNQGVAYLDDGTMVVVDNARRLISKHIDITVTSVLQTTAGKMIFARYDDRSQVTSDQRSAAAASSSA